MMLTGAQLERLVRRLDASLNRLEAAAIRRLDAALLVAVQRLEEEVRAAYALALTEVAGESHAIREARARALLQQVRALQDITSGAHATDTFAALTRASHEAGLENALAVLTAYERQAVGLSAVVRVEAAVRATEVMPRLVEIGNARAANNAARLTQHTEVAARKIEQAIIDGITRGQGWSKTAAEVRREVGITRRAAETIVRTESIQASDEARREAYQADGVEHVQRFATMDERVCGYCAYRAGRVYRASEAPAALHPNCRCYNAPWKREWQELGLTDDQWARAHRLDAMQRARAAGEKMHSGPSPFEKAAGLEAPEAVWSP